MEKSRFMEILAEEGYEKIDAEILWDLGKGAYSVDSPTMEEILRETCQIMKPQFSQPRLGEADFMRICREEVVYYKAAENIWADLEDVRILRSCPKEEAESKLRETLRDPEAKSLHAKQYATEIAAGGGWETPQESPESTQGNTKLASKPAGKSKKTTTKTLHKSKGVATKFKVGDKVRVKDGVDLWAYCISEKTITEDRTGQVSEVLTHEGEENVYLVHGCNIMPGTLDYAFPESYLEPVEAKAPGGKEK
jgi:hypothetical protein